MSSECLLSKGEPTPSHCSFDFDWLEKEPSQLKQDLIVKERGGAWRRAWIVQWGEQKVVKPFVAILKRGLEPKLLSLSTALGLTFGLVPIWGLAFVMCTLAAAILQSRCHVPTLMLANFVVSPFQLGLVVPFMRLGESVMRDEHFLISKGGFWEAVRGHEPSVLMFGILHAVVGWAIFAPVSMAILYVVCLPVFRWLVVRLEVPHH